MAVSVEDIRNTIIEVLTEIDDTIDADALKDDVPFREQPIPESDYVHLQTMNSTIEYLLPLLNN